MGRRAVAPAAAQAVTRALAFTKRASADIEEAYGWYEAQGPGLGAEFEVALELGLRLLRTAPSAGLVVHRTLRRLLVPKFPYSLYYRLSDEPSRFAVAYGARRLAPAHLLCAQHDRRPGGVSPLGS